MAHDTLVALVTLAPLAPPVPLAPFVQFVANHNIQAQNIDIHTHSLIYRVKRTHLKSENLNGH